MEARESTTHGGTSPRVRTIGGRAIPGIFTIPSGIIATLPPTIRLLAHQVPQLGILTTKSIGKEPRPGYREPIIAEYLPGGYINAVGLPNPGADAFREEIRSIYPLPGGKFLLTSIFGETVEDFVAVARTLAGCTDGFELNLSCPHGGRAGWVVGSDPELVKKIIRTLRAETGLPIVCKLSPQCQDIPAMARLCRDSGASALTLINTLGPAMVTDREGKPLLGHGTGGLSGLGILPLGIRCVAEASGAVKDIPIIAAGGIATASDVRAYQRAGASFFAVGSALAGLDTHEIAQFFEKLTADLETGAGGGTPSSDLVSPRRLMAYRYLKVDAVPSMGHDVKKIQLAERCPAQPGQFFFLCIPGEGEKPFSPALDDPLTFLVRRVGPFTSRLCSVEPGETLLVRGPYGKGFPMDADGKLYFLAGGMGVVPFLHYAEEIRKATRALFGSSEPMDGEFLREIGGLSQEEVEVVIDPPGTVGAVVRRLEELLRSGAMDPEGRFFISGPAAMISSALRVLREKVAAERVYFSREDYMKCGVGLCGSCATESGHRSCVEGPVFAAGEGRRFVEEVGKRGPDGRQV